MQKSFNNYDNNLYTLKDRNRDKKDFKLFEKEKNLNDNFFTKSTRELFYITSNEKEKLDINNFNSKSQQEDDYDYKSVNHATRDRDTLSPLKKIFESPYNYNYSYGRITPSQKSTGNNFNNTMFSAGMLINDNIEHSRNLSLKLDIENIDRDIKALQLKLKSLINNRPLQY